MVSYSIKKDFDPIEDQAFHLWWKQIKFDSKSVKTLSVVDTRLVAVSIAVSIFFLLFLYNLIYQLLWHTSDMVMWQSTKRAHAFPTDITD